MNKYVATAFWSVIATILGADAAFAETGAMMGGTIATGAGLGAGIAIGLAALGGTLAQGKTVSAALDSVGRNPSASGKVFTPMILGLVFMESLVIFSFVIAFFLQGKF